MLRPLLFLTLLFLLVIYWSRPDNSGNKNTPPPSAPSPKKPPPAPSKPGRTVAVGDLHSDLPQTLAVLRLANVIDEDANWSGGQDTLVQTGDIVDRGPDTIAVYNLFDKLRNQAKEVGGKVVNVYGNHEVMNLGEDLRYVTEEDYESFGGREKRRQAWNVRTGWLGKMIFKNFNITHIQNGHTIFTHGPIWSRSNAMQDGGAEETCRRVNAAKKALGVNRLISGHTPQYRTGKILSICNGGYMVIDVGISKYYGGHLAVLEILENDDGTQNVFALYPGGKRRL
ncbi:hypothetical protein BG011_009937 [Mortierella polycephala]|uniref:Calcineurin-like phosphoesterase domain-containing protein n=1 Tax=Mortierella polycephala TaxID=41804 RepID=A0A9P6TVU6_9FUNG|nr:hypothetical protein BG011_009937 [Mortierella polycephala]